MALSKETAEKRHGAGGVSFPGPKDRRIGGENPFGFLFGDDILTNMGHPAHGPAMGPHWTRTVARKPMVVEGLVW